jgi:tetratricopeptide (TPR) repeat protein
VARKGARSAQAPDRPRSDEFDRRSAPPEWQPEDWQSEGPPGPGPADATGPTGAVPQVPERPRRKAPRPVADELQRAVGPLKAGKLEGKLVDAASAFERDRPQDAMRLLRPLLRDAPDAPSVRELAGLTLYRLGMWAEAAKHLEAFRAATGSVEQDPVLADCYRALGRYAKVDALWDELREASPEPALMAEGRIVAAGALADRGDVRGAIRLLERGPVEPRRIVQPYHLRLWYALADLHERAGDAPRARELFARVVDADPDLADAAERLHALG